jgi:chloramphenicol 3-O-phosphotransferase
VKNWKAILIPTLITLTIGGIYLFSIWKHRQDPGVIGRKDAGETLSADDVVVMRTLFPAHFDDLKELEGTAVWMKNGYTMPYFAYTGGRVDFARRVGLIPAAQRLEVKKIVKAAVPAQVDDRIEHGSRQALAVFALPGSKDLYATPVGSMQGNEEAYYTDLLFFYDDPHGIYDHWPKDVWAAIDAHQVKPGMSELQSRMAIGQNLHADGSKEGDRTVTYNQDGKNWIVTYVKNRATAIKSE